MKHYDVVAIGDLNVDLILGVNSLPEFGREVLADSFTQHAGGVAANFATYCVRLGLNVALVARVGRDSYGSFLIEHMRQAGVSAEYIIRDDSLATGVTISLSGPADRAFITHLGTIDSLTAADLPDELLADARLVHVGSYYMQSKLQPDLPGIFRRAQNAGALTSLDTGYDPYERWTDGLGEVFPHLDLFLPNEVEAMAITGASDALAAGRMLAAGAVSDCRAGACTPPGSPGDVTAGGGIPALAAQSQGPAVALKLGGSGARLFAQGTELRGEPFRVQVVDTTCCGDSFDAGFVAAWLKGKTPQERLLWGNACGALVASGAGNAAEKLSVEAVLDVIEKGGVG